ncbi:hypothetical protein BDZ45DRAFT_752055 [Acephala macrosclerotiorum]|nr:hypothetical protein BDZ45DRAFT_752055 [Acephala macrosclerotiorum]
MNTLLHWNYRASESWRTFFRFDHMLQGKRPRSASKTLLLRMLDASKRGQMRKRGVYTKTDLLVVARKLYNAPDLQFRVPGQWNGVFAVMGPQPVEQVVLVIGTDFVLPMVALRGDILRRFYQVGIRPLVWSVDCKRSTSLVIVSVEVKLDRIVIDKSHLTITASDYRLCIVQLDCVYRVQQINKTSDYPGID